MNVKNLKTEGSHFKFTIEIEQYNVECLIAVCDDVEVTAKEMELEKHIVDAIVSHTSAFSIPVYVPNGDKMFLCLIKKEYADVDTINHEAMHLAFYIMEHIGHDIVSTDGGDEPFVYLQGFIAKKIRLTLLNLDKLVKE